MAKYRSKLTALHRIRSFARDAQQARVADAVRAEAAIEDQASAVASEISAAKAHQREVRTAGLDVQRVLASERYELVLRAQAAGLAKQQEAVAAELERRRADLAAAEQQVRVVEKIDERRKEQFERAELVREQKQMDEIATQQFLRQRKQSR